MGSVWFLVFSLAMIIPEAGRSEPFADLTLGGGVADQSFDVSEALPLSDVEFEALMVWHGSLAVGYRSRSLEFASAVSWSQRGGSLKNVRVGGIFRPELTRTIEFRRSYIDLSIAVRYCMQIGRVSTSLGVSPRASRLLTEEPNWLHDGDPKDWVFGVDPELRISYLMAFALVKYYWDWAPSYEITGNEMHDRTIFFGLGLRLTANRGNPSRGSKG